MKTALWMAFVGVGASMVALGCGGRVTVTGGAGSGGGHASSTHGAGGGSSTYGAGGAGATTGGSTGSCTMAGTWDGVSGIDGTNPSTSASYRFNADGTWIGGTYQQDPQATEFMHGKYDLSGGILTLNGSGMGPTCASSVKATYAATFTSGCMQLNLLTKTDGCTGGRLYLSASPDGTAMQRR